MYTTLQYIHRGWWYEGAAYTIELSHSTAYLHLRLQTLSSCLNGTLRYLARAACRLCAICFGGSERWNIFHVDAATLFDDNTPVVR